MSVPGVSTIVQLFSRSPKKWKEHARHTQRLVFMEGNVDFPEDGTLGPIVELECSCGKWLLNIEDTQEKKSCRHVKS